MLLSKRQGSLLYSDFFDKKLCPLYGFSYFCTTKMQYSSRIMNNHLGKHFFKPTLLAVILFVLSCLTGQAQTKVWANIVAGYANTPVVKVTRVAMYEDRTELSMFIDLVKGWWIAISPNTVLKTEGKEYVVKKATVLTLGERFTMPEDTLNFVLTFDPVSSKTEQLFDFPRALEFAEVQRALQLRKPRVIVKDGKVGPRGPRRMVRDEHPRCKPPAPRHPRYLLAR